MPFASRPTQASPSSSAAMLVAQGKDREASGDQLTALKRYGDALAIDPTSEEAYLALGRLRTQRGELFEAEQVYSTAMQHVSMSIALPLARAKVRRLAGRLSLAAEDLRRARGALPTDGSAIERELLREIIALKRVQGEPAAQLAAWRRLLSIARAEGDDVGAKEASVQVRALGVFVGDVDPALLGRRDSDEARKALAAIAKRQ